MNFQLRQRPSGSRDSVTLKSSSELMVKVQLLHWAELENNSEKRVSRRCKTQAQRTTTDQQDTQSGVRIVKEKVRTLVCYARELRGGTVGRLRVSLPWCVRFAARTISRSHRGTDGMTGDRRAYGRSSVSRRHVPLSEKVFYLEQSKKKVRVEAK